MEATVAVIAEQKLVVILRGAAQGASFTLLTCIMHKRFLRRVSPLTKQVKIEA